VTAHGERILTLAREVLHRADRITEEAAAAAGRYRGRLRLAGVPSACHLLPALIAEFGRRFPQGRSARRHRHRGDGLAPRRDR
jgi:DNA-binding transcriptional LysR family regulator